MHVKLFASHLLRTSLVSLFAFHVLSRAVRLAMLVHGIFLEACLIVWGKRKPGNCILDLTNDLRSIQGVGDDNQPIAAEVFCMSEMPVAKAAKARASKFIGFISAKCTPSCLTVSVSVASLCTSVHAWLFQSQILGLESWHTFLSVVLLQCWSDKSV